MFWSFVDILCDNVILKMINRISLFKDDLSHNKNASQSHTASGTGYGAENAVDGNTATCMRTEQIGPNSPDKTVWWKVDLGGVYNIYSVNILFKNYDGYGMFHFVWIPYWLNEWTFVIEVTKLIHCKPQYVVSTYLLITIKCNLFTKCLGCSIIDNELKLKSIFCILIWNDLLYFWYRRLSKQQWSDTSN